MRLSAIILAFCMACVVPLCALAQTDPFHEPAVPDSMKTINRVEALRQYFDSPMPADRRAACLRLGQIGGQRAMELLVQAFNGEPYRAQTDLSAGVRYFALISIGKVGGKAAERFLMDTATVWASNIDASRPHIWEGGDSIMTIDAAFTGLSEIASESAVAFLDSAFRNDDYDWIIRSSANMALLKIELRNASLATGSDTAQYLIDRLRQAPWTEIQFIAPGIVDMNYLVLNNIRVLLFQYRASTLPYVVRLMQELPADDPRQGWLANLRRDMERNPPRRQK